MIECEIEDVEIAESTFARNFAQRTVEKQWNFLLGNATVRAKRGVETGQIMS